VAETVARNAGGRKRLQDLGFDLPLLPASSVGSLPKPPELMEARAAARRGELSAGKLDEAAKRATEHWIRKQEELGLDVLVDGEMYRGDMVAYFAEHLRGFRRGGLVRSYGNRYHYKPVISGIVHWPGPVTVGWWKFAQSLTAKPVKGVLTGAYTMMDWSFNEHYPGRKAAAFAIARELRREAEALVRAGCKVIQIDEPALYARPEEIEVAVEAVRLVAGGLSAYFLVHACYGPLEGVYPALLEMPVHNLDLEMTNSEPDLAGLFSRHPCPKDVSIGVVDVHARRVETAEAVRRRVKKALEALAPGQVWVHPDCGLKTRTAAEAEEKLRVIAGVAGEMRAQL